MIGVDPVMSITANSTMKAVNISLKSIGITFRVVSGCKVTKKIKYSIKIFAAV